MGTSGTTADGEPRAPLAQVCWMMLAFTQDQIQTRGASIEVRINAEDPAAGFRPSPGLITKWQAPGGPGVRLDTHVSAGYRVPPNYDSLVAKLLVHRPSRNEAIAAMRRALAEFHVEGIKTTIPILRELIADKAFQQGKVDTTYIEREYLKKET